MKTAAIATCLLLASVSWGEGIRREIPEATWEPIFFRSINQVTELAGLEPLRKKAQGKDALEVRLWAGFGTQHLQGLIIERKGDQWRGWHLRDGFSWETRTREVHTNEVRPTRPWAELWATVQEMGILDLPDDSTLPDRRGVLDGISYVVEFQTEGRYRTFKYGNPGHQPWPEAESISKIVMLLCRELSLPLYQAPGTMPTRVEDGQVVLVRKGKAWGGYQLFDQKARTAGKAGDTARVRWAYRDDGNSELFGEEVVTGELAVEGWDIKFGPFSLRWSAGGYVYYPDPKGEMQGDRERQFVAITDLKSFDGLDAADEKWDYRAAFVDLPQAE